MARLLDRAASTILAEGLAGLNVRQLAQAAQVTPSLVAYHYGDFASFTKAAIWHTMMRGLPSSLIAQEGQAPPTGPGWSQELERAVRAGAASHPARFYVDYARILGQLGMMTKQEDELASLIMRLRATEGMGIRRASQAVWPRSLRLGRGNAAGFAIWIKRRAILNQALGGEDASSESVAGTAEALTPLRRLDRLDLVLACAPLTLGDLEMLVVDAAIRPTQRQWWIPSR
jgi:AcrR family transcriptional regulator